MIFVFVEYCISQIKLIVVLYIKIIFPQNDKGKDNFLPLVKLSQSTGNRSLIACFSLFSFDYFR